MTNKLIGPAQQDIGADLKEDLAVVKRAAINTPFGENYPAAIICLGDRLQELKRRLEHIEAWARKFGMPEE